VYGCVAARGDLDAVVHLGDYIYEYPNNAYGGLAEGDGRRFDRVPFPDRELVALDDYRARYAQYREDPDLQAAHRQHPFIVVWDDHEIANNAWRGGSPNHSGAEGDWDVRKAAARRAWSEWMPVRVGARVSAPMYRQFPLGDLGDLLMLDTRLDGRDAPASPTDVATIEHPGRQLLGTAQEEWLAETLRDSRAAGKPWQILGQQVMFAPQSPRRAPALAPGSWEGYRAARQRVFEMAAAADVRHLVVVTGDLHSAWAYDLARDPFTSGGYDPETGRGSVGTEIITPAVTSPGGPTADQAQQLQLARPHLRYVLGQERGYTILELTPDRLQADWWFVPTITERSASERCLKRMVSEAARPRLTSVDTPVQSRLH
jgi:alkaline phosphatase D